MKPWVIIDISYLAHRARYSTSDLHWEDFATGVLFGFWEQLRAICTDPVVDSNRVALCFDSKQSHRKKAYAPYKAHRREDLTDEERAQLKEMYAQVKLLRCEILPAIGFQVIRQVGCESDDVMAQIADQLTETGDEGIIVTADGDLWQCISPTVRWYDPARNKLYTPDSFKADKGIKACRWGVVKALAGCSGDGVAGIPGVGEKTAVKYLTNVLPIHYKSHKAITGPDGVSIFERNRDLVILPHPKTREVVLEDPVYNVEAFFHYCERYGFMTYLKEPKRAEWEAFFRGHQVKTRRRGE